MEFKWVHWCRRLLWVQLALYMLWLFSFTIFTILFQVGPPILASVHIFSDEMDQSSSVVSYLQPALSGTASLYLQTVPYLSVAKPQRLQSLNMHGAALWLHLWCCQACDSLSAVTPCDLTSKSVMLTFRWCPAPPATWRG